MNTAQQGYSQLCNGFANDLTKPAGRRHRGAQPFLSPDMTRRMPSSRADITSTWLRAPAALPSLDHAWQTPRVRITSCSAVPQPSGRPARAPSRPTTPAPSTRTTGAAWPSHSRWPARLGDSVTHSAQVSSDMARSWAMSLFLYRNSRESCLVVDGPRQRLPRQEMSVRVCSSAKSIREVLTITYHITNDLLTCPEAPTLAL